MSLQIHMLPITNGDSMLLVDYESRPPKHILIDTGKAKDEVYNYLVEQKVKNLDLIIITHFDLDHIGGLDRVIDNIEVKEVWVFDITRFKEVIEDITENTSDEELLSFIRIGKIIEKLEAKGIKYYETLEGFTQCIGKFAFEVLWPPTEFCEYLTHKEVFKKVISKRNIPEDWLIGSSIIRTFKEENPEKKLTRQTKKDLLRKEMIKKVEEKLQNRSEKEEKKEREWPTNHFSNNISTVLKVKILDDINNTTMLLTGDLEDWGPLLERHKEKVKAKILKIPHHGSKGVSYNINWCPWLNLKQKGDLIDLIDYIDPAFSLVYPLFLPTGISLPNSKIEHGTKCGRILSNRNFESISDLKCIETEIKPTILHISNTSFKVE